jgi:triosephosphate isomerase (TIM)
MTIRRPVIAGNWKLNHGPARARDFFRAFLQQAQPSDARTLAFFPPSLSLAAAREALGSREDILLGVQNLFWEESGAFTGEISAPLAREAGAKLALVGHSERRHVFGETEAETARKVVAALKGGLLPVLCVGESLEEREAGRAQQAVTRQLSAVLESFPADRVSDLLIAYEPVWAIGTGRTASPADASEMHQYIRSVLRSSFADPASEVPLLYGGSVKPENAAELLASPEVDGLLVGGASLDPAGFAEICFAKA